MKVNVFVLSDFAFLCLFSISLYVRRKKVYDCNSGYIHEVDDPFVAERDDQVGIETVERYR